MSDLEAGSLVLLEWVDPVDLHVEDDWSAHVAMRPRVFYIAGHVVEPNEDYYWIGWDFDTVEGTYRSSAKIPTQCVRECWPLVKVQDT